MNWLLLRGLVREQRHWLDFPDVLAATVPGARVHCLDFPGIGTERERRSPLSVAGIVADLRERWLALRDAHEGPWGILAVSLGGMVAMTWTQAHPADFARLVVGNTSAANLSAFHERFHWRGIGLVPKMLFSTDALERERAIVTLTSSGRADVDTCARTFAAYSLDLARYRDTGLRQLQAASRLRLTGQVPVPTLILASMGDRLVSPACSLAVARQLQAPMAIHPWAGHDLSLEASDWVAEQVAQWVGGRAL